MTLISGENIYKEFDEKVLFDGLSFSVNEDDRIGLVGPNGIGKTTLFEMMVGNVRADSGDIFKSKTCTIGYIEQEFTDKENLSLFDYVRTARRDLLELKNQIDALEHEMHNNPDSSELLEKLGDCQHRFEAAGGYQFESEIKIILIGLGFPENRFHNRLSNFSGGEKNRAALAKILAGRSNLLLLDEPTNHLDIESTIWLEEYLAGLDIAYIIVSHDRTFLSNTIRKVWEITGKKIEQYFGGFDKYLIERQERREQIRHLYRHQQEEISRIEDFIRRNMAGQKTKQAQSKQKYLSRLKRIELPETDKKAPSFSVESGGRSFNLVLAMEYASFGYGNHTLVHNVNFNIYRGDRIGLIGQNGSGKTTVLKTIIGELDIIDGSVRIGKNVNTVYFDQELSELNEKNTVLDEIWEVDITCEAGTLRSFLARFGFSGEDVFKSVSILSGGEKTKLALAKLLFKPANFLIFDEPTNHLDIDARQALEEALQKYTGAYIIVSHDRYFLDRVTDKILLLKNNTVRVFDGNYTYCKEKLEAEAELFHPPKKETSHEKLREYAEFKNLSRMKGRIKKELRLTRAKIEQNEKRLHRLDRDINHNIPKTDWEKLAAASEDKSKVEEQLINLYNKLEELEKLHAEYSDTDGQSG